MFRESIIKSFYAFIPDSIAQIVLTETYYSERKNIYK